MTDTIHIAEKVRIVLASKERLSEREYSFCHDVVKSARMWGWTAGRERVIAQVWEKLVSSPSGAVKVDAVELGSTHRLREIFSTASSKLKWPSITVTSGSVFFRAAPGKDGSIWITSLERDYKTNKRIVYGRIEGDTFTPTFGLRKLSPEQRGYVVEQVKDFVRDPVEAIKAHGRHNGCCCFCNTALGAQNTGKPVSKSTRRSVAAGFGETCAKRWGLHQEWKDAAGVEEDKVKAPAGSLTFD